MATPYIVVDGQCEKADNFYEKVFHGKNKEILRYNDYVPEANRDLFWDIFGGEGALKMRDVLG